VNGGQCTGREAVRNGQQYKDVVCLPLARYAPEAMPHLFVDAAKHSSN
jgi:hypothetical protein